jgi:hypothetical protein
MEMKNSQINKINFSTETGKVKIILWLHWPMGVKTTIPNAT